ncbi:Alpha/Beta hydrolase protein [Tricladium varicosporioides]|nr:Alpha/Beta hydrolase protein [Hymenoscyphus varicosporioides]
MRFLFLVLACSLPTVFGGSASSLPTVDLGYEIHRALYFDTQNQLYNFSNIRYAQAPVGPLRWAPPQRPLTNTSTVQIGIVGRVCPQSYPTWYLRGKQYMAGNPKAGTLSPTELVPPPDPRENEDCLFLDVLVPKAVFEKREKKKGLAPVMVWFYGGGFTFSFKGGDGDPSTIIKSSQQSATAQDGVIYVAFNYRAGAFGFLGGPNLQSNGSANVGLLDQRLALEWVQEKIHKFGGDKKRVTLFGQSAGGGSIMHQITAYGGLKGCLPFQQAILQSPGFQPYPSNWQQDKLLQAFLANLGVATINEARSLSYEALQSANINLTSISPYGSFIFAPTVDGSFVPALPGKLLLQGSYDPDLKLIIGHNANETAYFVNPSALTQADEVASIHSELPDAQPSIVEYIINTMYPYVFNTSLYSNPYELRVLSSAEVSFTCNTRFLASAFSNRTWAYRFSIPPAYHGQDVSYTYWNSSISDPTINPKIALAMQAYITEFAVSGDPNTRTGFPAFPVYGDNANMLDLNVTGIKVMKDDTDNFRCDWWQKALYF